MDPILIFLAIAIIIIAVAFFVSKAYKKTIEYDAKAQRRHERHDDGLSTGIGTGIGIDEGED